MTPALPSFVPRDGAQRKARLTRIAAMLAVLMGYVGAAAAFDGPIQVWLLALLPVALVLIAGAFRAIDPSDLE